MTATLGRATSGADPERLGGRLWLERTGGRLTAAQRRRLMAPIIRTHLRHASGMAKVLFGRRAAVPGAVIEEPPDSALSRAAEAACDEWLPPSLAAHSARTWWYGRWLADLDGSAVDPELFYVAALLHDVGLQAAVPGEDFTLRSARRADEVLSRAGIGSADREAVVDAVGVHTLPGLDIGTDGALGTYLQAGAMLDLVGLRNCDVPADVVRQVNERHPRGDLVGRISDAVRAESAAMPDGRFQQIRRWGFLIAVRWAVGV